MTPPRAEKLTAKQKMILGSLQAGHRAPLQFSAITGMFTGYVRVFNMAQMRDELVPWYRIVALLERSLIRLDGSSITTSKEVLLASRTD